MILYEEIYFEITLSGAKSELKKFTKFLNSGVLDDFLDVTSDMINYDDDFATADDGDSCQYCHNRDYHDQFDQRKTFVIVFHDKKLLFLKNNLL